MDTLGSVLIFILGLAIGSFLNVVVLRLPKNQNLKGRSYCPHCRKTLGVLELIPFVSFVLLKGRCKNCKTRISFRYPLIESITGLVFLWLWLAIRPDSLAEYFFFFESLILASFGIAVFIIDLEHYLILDRLVFAFALIFLVLNFIQDIALNQNFGVSLAGLIGAAIGTLPFYLIWRFSKGRLMGFGDVKLMLPLGLVLGWPNTLVALFAAVFLGSLVGLLLLTLGKKQLTSPLPFGCFLVIGAFLSQVYGSWLIGWYLSLLGI